MRGRGQNGLNKCRIMKIILFFLAILGILPLSAQTDTLRLSLDDCIAMARRQSIDAAVALGELRSAYWQ